jgi:hypothetical protein
MSNFAKRAPKRTPKTGKKDGTNTGRANFSRSPGENHHKKNRANPSIIVDRANFIAYANGILLERDASGRCIVGDSLNHERAEKLLSEGHAIALTSSGVTVSTMMAEKIDGKIHYVEKPWTELVEAVAIRPTRKTV